MSNNNSQTSTIPLAIRRAAQTSVAVFDLSDRTQVEITGSDRVRFLHNFTSNDIKRLKPGQGCETFVTNLNGKVVAHVFVFCGEESHWLDGTPGQYEAIAGHLGKFLVIDDVQIISRTEERGELFITGPMAAQLLQAEGIVVVGGHETRDSTGVEIDLRRVDLLRSPGFLMSIPREQMELVKRGLTAVGVVEGSREDFDVLRIEAGFPKYGFDVTDNNLAQEVARTKQCISFDKGCYLGQETIARLDSRGHTNRELRQLKIESSEIPKPGTIVFDSTGTTEVGAITSATKLPADLATSLPARVVAIGLMKRIAADPGTIVTLKSADGSVSGQIEDL